MSDPLWRLQDLERLTRHPSRLVRDWVRDRVEIQAMPHVLRPMKVE